MFTLCIFSRTIFYNIAQCFPERKFVKICIIGGIPSYLRYFFHTQNSLTLYSTISPITQLVRRSLGLGECRNRFELVPKHIPLPSPSPYTPSLSSSIFSHSAILLSFLQCNFCFHVCLIEANGETEPIFVGSGPKNFGAKFGSGFSSFC